MFCCKLLPNTGSHRDYILGEIHRQKVKKEIIKEEYPSTTTVALITKRKDKVDITVDNWYGGIAADLHLTAHSLFCFASMYMDVVSLALQKDH